MNPQPDSEEDPMVKIMMDVLREFEQKGYVACRGILDELLPAGDTDTPAYRRSSGLPDPGLVITTWPDGKVFDSPAERDTACLRDATRVAFGDLAQGDARELVHEAPAGIDHGAAKRASTGAKKAKRRTRSR